MSTFSLLADLITQARKFFAQSTPPAIKSAYEEAREEAARRRAHITHAELRQIAERLFPGAVLAGEAERHDPRPSQSSGEPPLT
jgi:hypothetical protein